jgi:uncharacterized protein (DUF1810 family)
MSLAYDLDRFVVAQQPIYPTVLSELKAGCKRTHWMWFVFPQVAGLGRSRMAMHYAVKSQEEAIAYVAHPLLGARLAECTQAVLLVEDRSAHQIFGYPDDVKFRSSMTLFDAVDSGSLYCKCLDRFFGGESDPSTLAILDRWAQGPRLRNRLAD